MICRINFSISNLLPASSSRFGLRVASFSSTPVPESNLAKLRKKTGLAFTLCKKALELHNNDIEAATAYLKEESIKHGYAKAAKLKSRRAAQGLVGLLMDKEAKRCALLEVNCETDFVARNSSFKQLIAQLTSDLFSPSVQSKSAPSSTTKNELVTKLIYTSEDLNFLNDQISQAISKLGENIKLSKALILHLNEPIRNDLSLFGHAHASGEYIADINGVQLGKYGSIVVVRQLPDEERKETINKPIEPEPVKEIKTSPEIDHPKEGAEKSEKQLTDEEIDNQELDIEFVEEQIEYTIDNVGKILCQQIIGMSPVYLKKSPEQLAKEKKLTEEGYKIPEDNDYLLDQKTIIDSSLSVADFCENQGLQIIDFVRFECGNDQES